MISIKLLFVLLFTVCLIEFNKIHVQCATKSIGGIETTIDKHPYQLSLQKGDKHICGAVVVNKSWALTTAKCVKGLAPKDITLRGGSTSHKSGGTVYNVAKIILHPSYNQVTQDYDIALIEVNKAFDLKTSKPITLASEGSLVSPGSQTTVTGWGVLTSGGTIYPDKLHEVTVPTVEQKICVLANGNQITDRMICAGFTSGGKDICDGDFGGPMVYQTKLIGISSASKSCGKPGSFGVYTSISMLRGWIKKTAGF